jgi:hypothetical protein
MTSYSKQALQRVGDLKTLSNYFEYLDKLRASGRVNMFDGSSELVREFDIPRSTATVSLLAWIETYDSDKGAATRAEEACR